MKIKLSNGKELFPLIVTGSPTYVQGAKRDTLTFVFPSTAGMEELDKAFSPTACESIMITDDNGVENIYNSYIIRAKLEKALVEVAPATPETEAITEERISVSMAQSTYVETQLMALTTLLTGEE